MDNPKKIKHINLNEGESPEENDILDDLQALVDSWRKDNLNNISPIASLQGLIDDYYSKPLTEMVGGDQEWHTKEQGEFFTLDGSENLGNTDYFKEDGFDIIHQSSGDHHLSDISPESEETYIPKGSKKIKKTVLKPILNKGPFNISILDEQHTEGDNVLGSEFYTYNHETRTHDRIKATLPKERFFMVTKALVSNFSLEQLETATASEPWELDDLISGTIKLYGLSYAELGAGRGDSLINKLAWAAIDNYEGISEGQIDNFDSLVLRLLKTFSAIMTENVTEYITYRWNPTLVAYDVSQAEASLYNNEDGEYSWYEWEDDPGFSKNHDDSDGDGVDIEEIKEIKSEPKQLKESHHLEEYKITEAGAAIMNHLRKDNDNEELQELLHTNIYHLPEAVTQMMKLYGWDNTSTLKMLIQFMGDINFEKVDYKQFIGINLPALKSYVLMKTFEESETQVKSATIEIMDTNWESAICSAQDDFWEWEPDYDYLETTDQDFIGNEEWESVEIDGKEVWRVGQRDNMYDPDSEFNKKCI